MRFKIIKASLCLLISSSLLFGCTQQIELEKGNVGRIIEDTLGETEYDVFAHGVGNSEKLTAEIIITSDKLYDEQYIKSTHTEILDALKNEPRFDKIETMCIVYRTDKLDESTTAESIGPWVEMKEKYDKFLEFTGLTKKEYDEFIKEKEEEEEKERQLKIEEEAKLYGDIPICEDREVAAIDLKESIENEFSFEENGFMECDVSDYWDSTKVSLTIASTYDLRVGEISYMRNVVADLAQDHGLLRTEEDRLPLEIEIEYDGMIFEYTFRLGDGWDKSVSSDDGVSK